MNMATEGDKEGISQVLLSIMEGYRDSTIPLLSDLQTEDTTKETTHGENLAALPWMASCSRKKPKPEALECGIIPLLSPVLHTIEEETASQKQVALNVSTSMERPLLGKAYPKSLMEFQIETTGRRKPLTKNVENDKHLHLNASTSRGRNKEKAVFKSPMEFQKNKKKEDKMTKYFSILQPMVPNISSKATRTQIVEQTFNYVQELKKNYNGLEEERKNKMATLNPQTTSTMKTTFHNSSISATVSGKTAVFRIDTEAQRFIFTKAMIVFEEHKTEVLMTTTSRHGDKTTVTVTALVNGNDHTENIIRDLIYLLGSMS